MNKESLIKIRELLVGIENLDIPIQDKCEAAQNLNTFLDEENYERHVKVLRKEFNEELRWKNK